MISIVIPTYNEEKCIRGTLKQFTPFRKRKEVEVIVSDGGSTDNTLRIASKYSDKVIAHKSKMKQRISEARDAGAKKARGDVLVFIDADVRIGNLNAFLKEVNNAFKDKEVAGANASVYVYPNEENLKDRFFHYILNIIMIFSKAARGECQVIRKSFFNKLRGYSNVLVAGEDFELFKRLRKWGKIVHLKDFKVYESPRRFRKEGYLRILTLYFLNFVFDLLFKKSFSKEWEPVR